MQVYLKEDSANGRQEDNFDFKQNRFGTYVKCLCLANLLKKIISSRHV